MANPEDLGRYRLKRLLGRGVLGEVWEASDVEQPGSTVAVKIMHAADDELALARSQFAWEARLATRLEHPNIAAVHDAGEAAGTSFLVMDMVDGKSLRTILRGDGAVAMEDKLRWLHEIADGLCAMHRAGLVHRDLKPENVIIRADGTACLVDLGIAKWLKFDLGGALDPDNAIEASVEAKPAASYTYAPPETITSETYDELGDQFAFGVIAYELITGGFPADDAPPLTSRDDVPGEWAAAFDRARSGERDARWEAMDLLIAELGGSPAPVSKPPNSNGRMAGSRSAETKLDSKGPEQVEPDAETLVREYSARAPLPAPSSISPLAIGAVVLVLVLIAILAIVLR